MTRHRMRPLIATLALTGSTWTFSAQALTIQFRDVSGGGGMTAEQLDAFQAAANFWTSKLSDPVTVYIDIAFNPLPDYVLGGTSSSFVSASYSAVRSMLALDAKSALDATAMAHLPSGPALSFQATQGDMSTRFDNDGSANNTSLGLTTANAKAMGWSIGTGVDAPDARIEFATGYAGDFSYTRTSATPANKLDFVTVAEHEIGHALGFTSGVDDIDYCAGAALRCIGSLPDTTAQRFENDWWYEPLDLYRYSAAGTLDMRVGQAVYFSVDGGATSIADFSTGQFNGDGWQASHFGPLQLNLMRAFVRDGESYDATGRDLAAFDAIGWDLAAAVPEPQTYALWLVGLAALGGVARRRQVH